MFDFASDVMETECFSLLDFHFRHTARQYAIDKVWEWVPANLHSGTEILVPLSY